MSEGAPPTQPSPGHRASLGGGLSSQARLGTGGNSPPRLSGGLQGSSSHLLAGTLLSWDALSSRQVDASGDLPAGFSDAALSQSQLMRARGSAAQSSTPSVGSDLASQASLLAKSSPNPSPMGHTRRGTDWQALSPADHLPDSELRSLAAMVPSLPQGMTMATNTSRSPSHPSHAIRSGTASVAVTATALSGTALSGSGTAGGSGTLGGGGTASSGVSADGLVPAPSSGHSPKGISRPPMLPPEAYARDVAGDGGGGDVAGDVGGSSASLAGVAAPRVTAVPTATGGVRDTVDVDESIEAAAASSSPASSLTASKVQ